MEFIGSITLIEWIIMLVISTVVGTAYRLIKDSHKQGIPAGGKTREGCLHYCQINRSCNGTLGSQSSTLEKETMKR